jgi:uncharacterized protein (TIGR03437 family)
MEPRMRTSNRLFPLALFFLAVGATSAQTPFSGRCSVTSVPLLVRSEGVTERLGDILLQCSGSVPGAVLSGNLTLLLPVNVTNRVDVDNLTRDAAVSVDFGSGFVSTGIAGQVSNQSIAFYGISLTVPASGSLNLKISGIRANVSQLGPSAQQPFTASLSSTIPVNQAQVVVAYPQISLQATLYSTGITCSGSPVPASLDLPGLFGAGTSFASTRVTEGFASAFEARVPGADSGTRFLVKYSGFPANGHIYIPDMVAGSDAQMPTAGGDLGLPQAAGRYVPGSGTLLLVRVVGADSTGAGGSPLVVPQGSGPLALSSASEVALAGGAGYAVYEVADANSSVQETAQFPTFIALANVTTPAVAQESISLAPVSSAAGASTTAPVPRFSGATPPSDCNSLGDCNAGYFPKLMVDATTILLTASGSTMTSQPGYIPIRNSAGGLLEWTVGISYLQGSGWLTLDTSAGVNNGSVRVWSQSQNLAAGTYHATIAINGGAAGSQTLPLTLTVQAAPPPPPPPPPPTVPSVTVSKVVNAATLQATPLVSGSLATVFGANLLGKAVAVTFDGAAASLLYTSATQINLQVPAGLGSKTSAAMVVTVDGASSASTTVALSPAWPAIFAHGVLNQDNTENTPQSGAAPGSILQIFATGIPPGAAVTVQIGDPSGGGSGGFSNLTPLYAGAAPTVPGVQQVNVAVPDGLISGPAQLTVCAAVVATTAGSQPYCSAGYSLAVAPAIQTPGLH